MKNPIYTDDVLKESLKTAISKLTENKHIPSDEILIEISKEFSTKLNEAYERGSTDAKVESDKLLTEKLTAQEDTFTAQLQTIADEFKKTITTFDTVSSEKLEKLNEAFKKKLENPLITDEMAKNLSKYLDVAISEAIPEAKVVDSIKLERYQKFYESIRKNVMLSNEELQEVIAAKLSEVTSTIKEQREALNTALSEKITLKEQLNRIETEKIIAESLKGQPAVIAEKVMAEFKDVTNPNDVKAKIKESIAKHEKANLRERRKISDREEVKNGKEKITVTEKADGKAGPNLMDYYAGVIEKKK